MAIEIIDILSQKNNADFPLVDSNDIRGGCYQVASTEERDLIPLIRRKEGMLCVVLSDGIYQLVGGISNENWTKFEGGSFSGSEELENTKIDDVVVDTQNGITYIKLYANNILLKTIEIKTGGDGLIHVGADEPTADNCEVWVDVSDDEEFSGGIEDTLVDEIRSIISNLQGEIDTLKKIIVAHESRIEYLELNGGGSSGGDNDNGGDGDDSTPTTRFVPLTFEGGEILTLEDGTILTFEELNY